MKVKAEGLGKRFKRNWIFRDVNLEIPQGGAMAITGRNGVGKSTLMKCLAGYLTPSVGRVSFSGKTPLNFNYAAPYQAILDEFTLMEQITFHSQFKQQLIHPDEMIERAGLYGAKNELISDFSSGMVQRTRLILAFYFKAEIIFLDEPTSNLDNQGLEWYQESIKGVVGSSTLVIASNDSKEYDIGLGIDTLLLQ